MVYSVLGAVGPRAAAAPVALCLGNDGSQLRSSRRHGSSLRGLLRNQEHAASSWTNSPNRMARESKISTNRLVVEVVFFPFDSNQTSKCLLGDSLFDQSDAIEIKRKKYWRSIIKKYYRKDGPLHHSYTTAYSNSDPPPTPTAFDGLLDCFVSPMLIL